MSRYIVSVKQLPGCTEKIQGLNSELRSYHDMLLTSDHSLNIVLTNISEYVYHLNMRFPQQGEMKLQELKPTDGIRFLHIWSGTRKATVTFKTITKEL